MRNDDSKANGGQGRIPSKREHTGVRNEQVDRCTLKGCSELKSGLMWLRKINVLHDEQKYSKRKIGNRIQPEQTKASKLDELGVSYVKQMQTEALKTP